MILSILYL